MPIYYHDFDPWRQAANRIADGMIAVHNAKNRQALAAQELGQRQSLAEAEMAQKQPVYDAQTENYRAGARKDNAAAALDEGTATALNRASKSLGQALLDTEAGRTGTEAQMAVWDSALYTAKGDPTKAADTAGKWLSIIRAARGDARGAGLYTNPASVANNEADNARIEKMGFNVPANTVRMAPDGSTIGTGLLNIPRGNKIMSLSDGMAADVAQGNPVQPPSGANPYTDTVKYWNRKVADWITDNGKPNDAMKPALVQRYTEMKGELADAMRKERMWGKQTGAVTPSVTPTATQPDITEAEYNSLKSGSKYWFGGKEYTKE